MATGPWRTSPSRGAKATPKATSNFGKYVVGKDAKVAAYFPSCD